MTVPRLRFAPSPTGYLHVGGARTALFNWLYARRAGGIFVLRIEDTDVERSSWDKVAGILEGLRWLGLDWDEGPEVGGPHGPYFQSQRLGRYREMAERLVGDGHAYYCYCNAKAGAAGDAPLADGELATPEPGEGGSPKAVSGSPRGNVAGEVPQSPGTLGGPPRGVFNWSPGSSLRLRSGQADPGSPKAQDAEFAGGGEEGDAPRGESWTYDRRCLRLTADEVAAREAAETPRAIRFRVPEGATTFHDLVHGDITFDNTNIEDFVALRSDGHPTYHLSVVVDDIDMAITHVVRGDDHISNTPKQVLLYRAFGECVPAFAHVPLILGLDKRRLSKRHGATSVIEYERQGFVPEAMVNFLALLGWSPGSGNRELFGRDELIEAFSLEGISSSNAVFNVEKLEWFSAQHIAAMSAEELARRIEPLLRSAGVWRDGYAGTERESLRRLIELLRPRAKRLTDFVEKGQFFLADAVRCDQDAVQKHLATPESLALLRAVRGVCATTEPFTAGALEPALRELAVARGVKPGALIHPTRVAVTGQAASPGIFDVLELLGRERVLARIDACLVGQGLGIRD
jgi:glutamyl-tRNA synthetase